MCCDRLVLGYNRWCTWSWQNAKDTYFATVTCFVHLLKNRQYEFLSGAIATLLTEPQSGIYAGLLMYKGLDRHQFTHLNPKILTDFEQLNTSPVLLIHGNCSSSGVFAPMIEHMCTSKPNIMVFSIDLVSSDGIVSAEHHLQKLIRKVYKIRALYGSIHPNISLVGHSSGGDVIPPLVQALKGDNISFGALIKIGSFLKENEDLPYDQLYEVGGTCDILEGHVSILSEDHHLIRDNVGHVGLLFDETVLSYISPLCGRDGLERPEVT